MRFSVLRPRGCDCADEYVPFLRRHFGNLDLDTTGTRPHDTSDRVVVFLGPVRASVTAMMRRSLLTSAGTAVSEAGGSSP